MKNLFPPHTVVWYFNSRIQKPHKCVYLGPVIIDEGGRSDQHNVSFNENQITRVASGELYLSKEDAQEIINRDKKVSLHDLDLLVAVYKLKT